MKLLLTASLLSAAITPAFAAEPTIATSTVRSGDLDLGTASGQQTLEHRLSIAIVDACGNASNIDLEGQNAVRFCRVEARAKVVAERDRLIDLASRGKGILFASAH